LGCVPTALGSASAFGRLIIGGRGAPPHFYRRRRRRRRDFDVGGGGVRALIKQEVKVI